MKTKLKIILLFIFPIMVISQSDSTEFVKDSVEERTSSEDQRKNPEESIKSIKNVGNESPNSNLYKEMYNDSKSTNKWLIGIFLTFLGLLSAFFIYTLKQQNNRIEQLNDTINNDKEKGIIEKNEVDDKPLVKKENESDDQLSKPDEQKPEVVEKSELEPNKYTAISLIFQNKINEADDEFKKYLIGKTDDEKAIETIDFEYYKFINGDTNSNNVINKLIDRSNNPTIKSIGHIRLGNAYFSLGSIEKAKERAELVIQLDEDEFLVEANILLAKTLQKKSDNPAAEKLLNKKIKEDNSDNVRFKYLMALNEVLGNQSKDHERIEVLENALILKPNDTNVLFKLAYNYTELDFKKLGLNCYQKILSISNDGATNNNISILYENFNLDIYRVAHLKAGMKLKESYAGPNLALHFLENGFIEEAREIIKNEEEVGNKSERFLYVKGEIDRIQSHQKDLKKKIEEEGEKMRNFLKYFSLKSREDLSIQTGQYKLNDIYVDVNITDGKISISWRFDDNNNFEISGLINGNSVYGNYKQPYKSSSGYGTSKTEYVFFNNYKSYIYYDSNRIFVMVIEKDGILNNWILNKQ